MISTRWLTFLVCASCAHQPSINAEAASPSVGLFFIEGKDPAGTKPLKIAVFTPPSKSTTSVSELGPYRLEATPEAGIGSDLYPLVVISHGHAGSRFGHHGLAEYLARAGFIVAAIEHAGDSWNDQSGAGSDRVMYGRAYHVSAAIDAVFGDATLSPHVDQSRIGVAGFSAGGYTALTAVGALPNFELHRGYCERHPKDAELCSIRELRLELRERKPMRDPRIKAAFVMAPLALFFGEHTLDEVKVPVFLSWAEQDAVLLPQENAALLLRGLKSLTGQLALPGAGHYVFLSPCSQALAAVATVLCLDPPGVDRIAIHQSLNREAAVFFANTLQAARP